MINQQKMNNDNNNNIELSILIHMRSLVDHVGKQCHFCLSCERFSWQWSFRL